jgi:hypothetical protein
VRCAYAWVSPAGAMTHPGDARSCSAGHRQVPGAQGSGMYMYISSMSNVPWLRHARRSRLTVTYNLIPYACYCYCYALT